MSNNINGIFERITTEKICVNLIFPYKLRMKQKKHNDQHTAKAVNSELAAQKFNIMQNDENN